MNITKTLAAVVGLMALTTLAGTKTWKDSGATDYTDWTNPDNFEEGKPAAGDTVSIPADVTVYLNASDAASCALVQALDRIQPEAESAKLVVTVNPTDPNGGVLELGCKIAHSKATTESAAQRQFGEVVKEGEGELFLTDGSNRYYYYTSYTVNKGTLRLPQNCNTGGERYFCKFKLAEGTKLFTCTGSGCNDTYCRDLIGKGTVTNTLSGSSTALLLIFGGTAAQPVNVQATFAPNTKISTNGYVDFRNADYAYKGLVVNYGGHVNFTNFGYANTTGQSSLGHGAVELKVKGGRLHYLGEGEETTRRIEMHGSGGYGSSEIDGGAHGGLNFLADSEWICWYGVQNLILSGAAGTVNTMSGKINEYMRPSEVGHDGYLTLTKKGAGTWRLKDNVSRGGLVNLHIEEGTLELEALRELGYKGALGTSLLRYPFGYMGSSDTDGSLLVDYAIAIGGINGTEGTLSYVGATGLWVTNRLMAVVGDSRLVNNGVNADLPNGPSFRLAGLTSMREGVHTLTLDGDGAQECAVGNLSEKTGQIKVVKEGEGTWSLVGDNAFTGGLDVKEGTLNVVDPAAPYTWFKWVVKESYQQYYNDDQVDKNWSVLCTEFGLYDADGNRVNGGLTRAGTDTSEGYESLMPGQVAIQARYGTYGKYAKNIGNPIYLFDDHEQNAADICLYPSSRQLTEKDKPETWITFVMRMPEGAKPVASYDLSFRKDKYKHAPRVWEVLGSADGVHWDSLDRQEFAEDLPLDGNFDSKWMFAKTRKTSGSAVTHEDGQPIPGAPKAGARPDALAAQDYVQVERGATLAVSGEAADVTELRIDATSGLGTISGLSMAADGTLSVTGADTTAKQLNFPADLSGVEGLANIGTWTVKVNDAVSKNYVVTASESGISLAKKGMMVILR